MLVAKCEGKLDNKTCIKNSQSLEDTQVGYTRTFQALYTCFWTPWPPYRPPCLPSCRPPCPTRCQSIFSSFLSAVNVGHHVGHLIHLHVGHHIVVSTLQEVSEMLTEWKSKSVTYGSRTTDGRMDAENPLQCASHSDSLAFKLSERKRGGKRGRWPSLSAPPPFTRSSPRWSPPWRWFLTSSFCCFLAAFHFLTFVQQDSHSRQPQFCARFANSIAKMMMMTFVQKAKL